MSGRVQVQRRKEKKKEKVEKKEKKEKNPKKEKKEKNPKKEKKPKDVISLSVAIYRPEDGNLHHWALHLEPHNWVYQVTGEPMDFSVSVTAAIPTNSGRFVESIGVAEINPNDLNQLDQIIKNTPVQNDVQGWCCQDFVVEALELLNEEQIVDDEDYEGAMAQLREIFNS